MKYYLHEIFEQLGETNSIKERKKILQSNDSPCMKKILKYAFDPSLPNIQYKTVPQYTENDAPLGFNYISLNNVYKSLPLFFAENPSKRRQKKMNQKLVGILETLHRKEANIFIGTIIKKLKFNGLTEFLVRQTFPGLLTETRNTEENENVNDDSAPDS